MDVVPDAGTVGRRVVGAEDQRTCGRLPTAGSSGQRPSPASVALGVACPTRPPVSEPATLKYLSATYFMGDAADYIPQHPFRHEFRGAVGIYRCCRGVFRGVSLGGDTVDRGSRGKHEVALPPASTQHSSRLRLEQVLLP